MQLLKSEDIAEKIQMSKRYVAETLTLMPSFPEPVVFKRKRRWIASEVDQFILSFQKKKAGRKRES